MNGPVRALLVNENIGGHATVHHHLRTVAGTREDISIRIVEVPPPNLLRKLAAAPVPLLSRWDADLRPVRYQLAQSVWVARMLPRWLAEEPVDVVHLYTHNTGLLAGKALRGKPYVVTLDSTNAQSNLLHPIRPTTRFSSLSTPVVTPFERRLYRGAARVVANSRWAAESLVRHYGLDPEQISTLPMGVPLPPPSAGSPAAGATAGAAAGAETNGAATGLPRVLFIGRSMQRKGGVDLLRAHQRGFADRAELVLVTGDDVDAIAAAAGLDRPLRNVTVVGDAKPGDGKVDAQLAGADIMALPSSIDQWPNAVMEAMSHGVTPVVSAVGGMPEMVLDGAAGVVLDQVTPDSIGAAVTALLDDPARRRRLGERARRRVVEDLDVTITANRLLDVIRDAAR